MNVVNSLTDLELERVSELLDKPIENADPVSEQLDAQAEEVRSVMPSSASGMTQNTAISSLKKQLQEEKEARFKLESELQSLKQISLEI